MFHDICNALKFCMRLQAYYMMQAHIWAKMILWLGSPFSWRALKCCCITGSKIAPVTVSDCFEVGLSECAAIMSSPRMTGRLLKQKIQVLLQQEL